MKTHKLRMSAKTTWLVLGLAGASTGFACGRSAEALTPERIEQQYGVSGAYTGEVATPDGRIKGTLVPITLEDGHKKAELVIPQGARNGEGAFIRDEQGIHPLGLQQQARREELTRSPAIVQRTAEPQHRHKRSWEQEALIIGGSAGAGAGIGAIAGGKKGAAIGAATGGVGGLIYDLMTKNKK